MNISKDLIYSFVGATERAAYGASLFKGKNDKIGADQAAVDEMRLHLNSINMRGRVVIGEGELDEAPMLYTNEELGNKNGDEFDNSRKRGTPFEFTVGKGQVIEGWDKGLIGMQVGGTRVLVIPPEMAYGSQGIGPIPGNATLVFSIELVEIK